MARANGLDNLSYADLLTLQEKIAAAIVARKSEDAKATKDQLLWGMPRRLRFCEVRTGAVI